MPDWIKAMTPIIIHNSRHLKKLFLFSRTSVVMRSCSVSFKELIKNKRKAIPMLSFKVLNITYILDHVHAYIF